MLIDSFYTEQDGVISFTREQGSEFAKGISSDFNPLHDADGARFCIPGDLLFAVVLARYGVSRHMEFFFSGMVTDNVELILPPPANELVLCDAEGRDYLRVERSGGISDSTALIENLTRSYVEFSGETFPHILAPLMAEQNAMINYARPIVMYQSMTIDLDTLAIEAPLLQSDHNALEVNGRRGAAKLAFNLLQDGQVIGRGCKRMALGGLREYDQEVMALAIADYDSRREVYLSGRGKAGSSNE